MHGEGEKIKCTEKGLVLTKTLFALKHFRIQINVLAHLSSSEVLGLSLGKGCQEEEGGGQGRNEEKILHEFGKTKNNTNNIKQELK